MMGGNVCWQFLCNQVKHAMINTKESGDLHIHLLLNTFFHYNALFSCAFKAYRSSTVGQLTSVNTETHNNSLGVEALNVWLVNETEVKKQGTSVLQKEHKNILHKILYSLNLFKVIFKWIALWEVSNLQDHCSQIFKTNVDIHTEVGSQKKGSQVAKLPVAHVPISYNMTLLQTLDSEILM